MNCPECGERMTFSGDLDGTWETTVGYFSPPSHDHDDNCLTRTYRCKNGHAQIVSKRRRCPACDWVGKETCSCHPNKKVDEWPVAELAINCDPDFPDMDCSDSIKLVGLDIKTERQA